LQYPFSLVIKFYYGFPGQKYYHYCFKSEPRGRICHVLADRVSTGSTTSPVDRSRRQRPFAMGCRPRFKASGCSTSRACSQAQRRRCSSATWERTWSRSNTPPAATIPVSSHPQSTPRLSLSLSSFLAQDPGCRLRHPWSLTAHRRPPTSQPNLPTFSPSTETSDRSLSISSDPTDARSSTGSSGRTRRELCSQETRVSGSGIRGLSADERAAHIRVDIGCVQSFVETFCALDGGIEYLKHPELPGYRQTGSYRKAAGYDVVIEGKAGLMHMYVRTPARSSIALTTCHNPVLPRTGEPVRPPCNVVERSKKQCEGMASRC
jgi:hypothetical protein